jgi:predicted transcriptional regulator of viral defense system
MIYFEDYLKDLRSAGRYSFTGNQAAIELGISKKSLISRCYIAKKNGDLISPARNFYVAVPPEYRKIGSLPPEELIPLLMEHWGLNYYACLLSAAHYHGASHQKAQVFQVMVPKQIKDIHIGKVWIQFIYKKEWELPLEFLTKRVVKTGYLTLSSPELTLMDLLNYPKVSGGLNSIATVLSELIEAIDLNRLQDLLKKSKTSAWWQRLGCILEKIEVMEEMKNDQILALLRKHAEETKVSWISLVPGLPIKEMRRNSLWKVIENADIEGDL